MTASPGKVRGYTAKGANGVRRGTDCFVARHVWPTKNDDLGLKGRTMPSASNHFFHLRSSPRVPDDFHLTALLDHFALGENIENLLAEQGFAARI